MTGPALENQVDTRGFYVPQKAYEFVAFNTINTVIVFGEGEFTDVFEAVQAEAERYEHLFSHTDPHSELSRFNRSGCRAEDVDPELIELIDLALAYSTASGGLFDPAFAWHEGDKGKEDNKEAEGEKETDAFSAYDEASGEVRESGLRITSLGGIAKGYIADELCNLLKQYGVEHAIVNLGGNVKVFGGKPAAKGSVQPFSIGLRVPKKYSFGEDSFATVQLSDGAVVTSGIYERGTRAPDGTWLHHIVDPRTGRSAETDLVSASVISESALEADAFATALIVMGLERAQEFIEQVPSCEAVFVATDGQVHATSGMGSKVPFTLL